MSYNIISYCPHLTGEIIRTATNKKAAMAHHDALTKTALQDLNIPRNSRAMVVVMYKKDMIVRSNVSYGANGKPVIDTTLDPLNLKKKPAKKAA